MGLGPLPVLRIVCSMQKEWTELILCLRWSWRCASFTLFSAVLCVSFSFSLMFSFFSRSLAHSRSWLGRGCQHGSKSGAHGNTILETSVGPPAPREFTSQSPWNVSQVGEKSSWVRRLHYANCVLHTP